MYYSSKLCTVILTCFIPFFGVAQVDSLETELNKPLEDTIRSKVYYLLSLEFDRNDPERSRSYANQALEILESLDEERAQGKAMCHKVIGNTQKNQGNYDEAIASYLEVIKWTEKTGDETDLAPVYNDIGVVYKIMRQFDKAMPYYKKANALCRQRGNANGEIMTLNNIGTIHDALGNTDSASFIYKQAFQMAQESKNYRAMAIATNNLGELEGKQNNYLKALEYFMETLTYDRKTQDDYGMTYSFLNIGNTLRQYGDTQRMHQYYDSTLLYAEKMGLKQIIQHTYQSYAYFYDKQDDYKNALKYQLLYAEMKDSIYAEERMRRVEELEAKYETAQKEREIAQLSEAQTQASLDIAQQRIWILMLIAGVLISIGGGGFLVYRRRRISQAKLADQQLKFQKEILDSTVEAQEKERQRIAKDLHDGLVQSLAALKLGIQNALNNKSSDNREELFTKHITQIDEAADEARNISHQMMPRTLLEMGMIPAIEEMLSKTLGNSSVSYRFDHFAIEDMRFAKNIEISLFRISQELVNNIMKHSGATEVDVQIYKTKSHLILHVEDNGKGFKSNAKSSGLGMNNIYSRASSVNGDVQYEQGEVTGTVANVRVPI